MLTIHQLFKSMQFQLIFWSMLALLLLAVVAGGYGFWYSYKELNEFQDDNLKSMTTVLEHTLNLEGFDSRSLQNTNTHFDIDDDDGSITVDIITTKTDTPIAYNSTHQTTSNRNDDDDGHNKDDFDDITLKDLPTIPIGISTKIIEGDTWRVYRSHDVNKGNKPVIIVRQRTEFQDDLAKDSALQSFLPLIIGISLLGLLLPFIMWRMLKPVRQLQTEISQRRESDLNPLPVGNLPTELLPLAQSLNRLLALVKLSSERQQRFIADAAHEMRSPLTAISLQLQRLQRLSHNTVTTEGLAKLAVRLQRNQDFVEQLLALARAGNIKASDNTEPHSVSIKATVEQIIGLLIPIIDNKNIELTVQLPTHPSLSTQVNIDETSLLLLVKNLIQNAIIYTPNKGQVAVKLFYLHSDTAAFQASASDVLSRFGTQVVHSNKAKTRIKSLDNTLILQIMDTGRGIEPKDYASAFEPFIRMSQTHQTSNEASDNPANLIRSDSVAKKADEINGSGLGLSIVKSICEQAGIDVFMSPSTLITSQDVAHKGLCVTLVF